MNRLVLAAFSMFPLVSGCIAQNSHPSEEAPAESNSAAMMTCGWFGGGDCADVPWGNWRSPEFWGDYYLNKYSAQLQSSLDSVATESAPDPLPAPRPVLLITGVTIKAKFFDPIVARLTRDGFQPIVWEPPALLSGSLFEAANDLSKVIDQARADAGVDKIDILAECTGGLITRYYLESMGGAEHVSHFVTFVSPENGIPVLRWIAPFVGWPALHDLTPGSAFLNAVHGVPLPSGVPATSIYTCTDEYIQPYTTSIIEGATNIGLCDHGFVGHFQTFYDPQIYLVMHDALIE
jgi:triacylglycerol esterase/lipase EstA (alpha/beta hydrolase family)